jgi:sec-independent protein translocase protein TatA
MLGLTELILVLILVVFFYGGKRLPQIGDNLGKGISQFKKSLRGSSPTEAEKEKELGTAKNKDQKQVGDSSHE